MKQTLALLLLSTTIAAPAFAFDDEMMGTMANGRMETRNERFYRVQDPEMDREEAEIDREKRLNRKAVDADPDHDYRVRGSTSAPPHDEND